MDRNRTKRIAIFVIGFASSTGTSMVVRQLIDQNLDRTNLNRYQTAMVGLGAVFIAAYAAMQVSKYEKSQIEKLFDLYDEYFPEAISN